jgi:hypothetical protein
MRLAGVLAIMNMHSWSDYTLNLANSAANIVGIIAAALVLIAMVFIYFTRSELDERGRRKIVAPQQDQAKALEQMRAELAAIRQSEETKTLRLSEMEKELATTKHSEESMASRLSQTEKDLAATRRVIEEKALRLSQVEAELAIARHSAEEAKALARQLEQKQGPRKITPEQRAQFLNAVRGRPTGKVIVSAFFNNKETHDFSQEILSLLKEGGFEVIQSAPINFFTTSRPSSGVRIGCEDIASPPPHFATVEEGFRAIGLDAPTTTLINAREKDVLEIQVTPKQ